MKDKDLLKEPRITPFSNGTQAMAWQDLNCDCCARNKAGECDTNEDLIKKANSGRHCRWEIYIGAGFVLGDIAEYAARRIGYTDHGGWPQRCLLWKNADDKGGPHKPRTKPVAPNQMIMPLEFEGLFDRKTKRLRERLEH